VGGDLLEEDETHRFYLIGIGADAPIYPDLCLCEASFLWKEAVAISTYL
jgi:hypothetical protein